MKRKIIILGLLLFCKDGLAEPDILQEKIQQTPVAFITLNEFNLQNGKTEIFQLYANLLTKDYRLLGDAKFQKLIPNIQTLEVGKAPSEAVLLKGKNYMKLPGYGWKSLSSSVFSFDTNKVEELLASLHISTDKRYQAFKDGVVTNQNPNVIQFQAQENSVKREYTYEINASGFIQAISAQEAGQLVYLQKNQFLKSFDFSANVDDLSEESSKAIQTEAEINLCKKDVKTLGFFVKEQEGKFVVFQVLTSSSAYTAGMRAGQILEQINGTNVTTTNLDLLSINSGVISDSSKKILVNDEKEGEKLFDLEPVILENFKKGNGKFDVEIIIP
ncbi:MAG: hypothetical protein K1X66_01650 [Verrucomicrobiae bacterium]|nr:hypothetical protein [Verrucomicrobiae bacterium]